MATPDEHFLEGDEAIAAVLCVCDLSDLAGKTVPTSAVRLLLRHSQTCYERGHRARRADYDRVDHRAA